MTGTDGFHFLLAVVLPPMAVYVQDGFGTPFWINVVLTFLGYVPGLVHVLWRTRYR